MNKMPDLSERSEPIEPEGFASFSQAECAYYQAYEQRDTEAMMQVWSTAHSISCLHVDEAAINTRDALRESWQTIFALCCSDLHFQHDTITTIHTPDRVVRQCLETAYCGDEQLTQLVITNTYQKDAQGWHLIAHQSELPDAHDHLVQTRGNELIASHAPHGLSLADEYAQGQWRVYH